MSFRMLKRDIRLFMRCLVPAAVYTMVFSMVCAAAAFVTARGAETVFSPVRTAVVDGEDSMLSRLLISAVADMDYIADMMEVVSCDREAAMEGLRDGTYSAVIVLPEGMIDGILSGRETQGRIYLSEAAAAHGEIVAGIAAFGETMLTAGQYGIFSGEQLIRENDMQEQFRQDFLTRYNMRLLSEAMDAGSVYFDVQVTDYADTNMSTVAHYALCWLTFLMMLIPVFLSGLYTGDLKRPILCRLRGLGVGDGAFLFGKILLPFGFVLLIVAGILWGVTEIGQLKVTLQSVFAVAASTLLAVLISGSCIMAGNSGAAAVVVVSGSGMLLCGGIIPRQLLPQFCLTLGSVTPFGSVQNLLQPIFGGRMTLWPLAAGLIYGCLLLLCVKWRLKRIRIGGDTA